MAGPHWSEQREMGLCTPALPALAPKPWHPGGSSGAAHGGTRQGRQNMGWRLIPAAPGPSGATAIQEGTLCRVCGAAPTNPTAPIALPGTEHGQLPVYVQRITYVQGAQWVGASLAPRVPEDA